MAVTKPAAESEAPAVPVFGRVLLKLSGEALMGTTEFGLDAPTVDTRALEVGAEAILMAKNGVRGVFDGDPRTDPSAEFLPALTHLQAIERGLKVMDTTALSLCMDNQLPIYVFELAPGNIGRVVAGESVGTIIDTP